MNNCDITLWVQIRNNTIGSKVYPPIMCISIVSLYSGMHFSCIPTLPYDLPMQSDPYIHMYVCMYVVNLIHLRDIGTNLLQYTFQLDFC